MKYAIVTEQKSSIFNYIWPPNLYNSIDEACNIFLYSENNHKTITAKLFLLTHDTIDGYKYHTFRDIIDIFSSYPNLIKWCIHIIKDYVMYFMGNQIVLAEITKCINDIFSSLDNVPIYIKQYEHDKPSKTFNMLQIIVKHVLDKIDLDKMISYMTHNKLKFSSLDRLMTYPILVDRIFKILRFDLVDYCEHSKSYRDFIQLCYSQNLVLDFLEIMRTRKIECSDGCVKIVACVAIEKKRFDVLEYLHEHFIKKIPIYNNIKYMCDIDLYMWYCNKKLLPYDEVKKLDCLVNEYVTKRNYDTKTLFGFKDVKFNF